MQKDDLELSNNRSNGKFVEKIDSNKENNIAWKCEDLTCV